MAAYADIARALFDRVATLNTGSPALEITYPEPVAEFHPPASRKYLEVQFFSNRPRWEGLAEGRIDQGLLQVTVVWPPRQGIIAPSAVADTIIAHFDGATMVYQAAKVKTTGRPWAASPIIEKHDVRIPVTISWTA